MPYRVPLPTVFGVPYRLPLPTVFSVPYSSVSTALSVQLCQYSSVCTALSVQLCQYSSVSTALSVQLCQYSSVSTALSAQLCQYSTTSIIVFVFPPAADNSLVPSGSTLAMISWESSSSQRRRQYPSEQSSQYVQQTFAPRRVPTVRMEGAAFSLQNTYFCTAVNEDQGQFHFCYNEMIRVNIPNFVT